MILNNVLDEFTVFGPLKNLIFSMLSMVGEKKIKQLAITHLRNDSKSSLVFKRCPWGRFESVDYLTNTILLTEKHCTDPEAPPGTAQLVQNTEQSSKLARQEDSETLRGRGRSEGTLTRAQLRIVNKINYSWH